MLDQKLQEISSHRSSVTVSYFVPCEDPYNDAFDLGMGIYESITGAVDKIDRRTQTLLIAGKMICFDDIGDIEFEEDVGTTLAI